MSVLPIYSTRELILERLQLIFPEGIPNRNYFVREIAASTVFAMLYIGAIEGSNVYMAPKQVYKMTQEQAALIDDKEREDYRVNSLKPKFSPLGKRWYADNSREPIRDETIREGLQRVGAILSLNIATTSSKPRYYLKKDFSLLFDPTLQGDDLLEAIELWKKNNLSQSALTRLRLANLNYNAEEAVLITFPNNETRTLSAGPSSVISKAVIEVFAPNFLEMPVVLWLSTSDNKVVQRDDRVASSIGLNIEPDKNLPDIILADLGPTDPLLVFVEVVATDGAITDRRKEAILDITDQAKFSRTQVIFVTAYHDRESGGFKKTITSLAWDSFAWFVSEPDKIIVLKDGITYLSKLTDT